VLGLWATEFGAGATGKAMFSREWMAKQEGKAKDKDDEEEAEKPTADDD
jgi:hypothetical protein